jgi:hypothetical protein
VIVIPNENLRLPIRCPYNFVCRIIDIYRLRFDKKKANVIIEESETDKSLVTGSNPVAANQCYWWVLKIETKEKAHKDTQEIT